MGAVKYANPDDDIIMHTVRERFSITSDAVELYPKATVHNQTIFSKLATRIKKHNNYTVLYTDPDIPEKVQYGRVEAFVVVPVDCLHLAIVQPLTVSSFDERLNIPEEMTHLGLILLH